MSDLILKRIHDETSSACLMALRAWAVGANKWSESLHQKAYDARLTELEGRWK